MVDYKTDTTPRDQLDMLVEHDWPQVALNAMVWQDTLGQPVCEQSLLFSGNRSCK
jgi:hypothetical protein